MTRSFSFGFKCQRSGWELIFVKKNVFVFGSFNSVILIIFVFRMGQPSPE